MKTLEFFKGFVSPTCHKIEHNTAEYDTVREHSVLVKATTFYEIYKHNVFVTDGRLSLQDFYRVCGQYLYYDKYVCEHGTEFYYHIIWGDHPMVDLTKDLIAQRVSANAPEHLQDLQYVVRATSREKE